MKKLIIFGGQGNGTVALSTVEDINKNKPEWKMLGFLNDSDEGYINGYPVLGSIEKKTVQKFLEQDDVYFFWSLISTKLNHSFIYRLKELEIPTNRFATLIHPTAIISKYAKIGNGVSVQPFVSVGPNVTIGNHVQIYAQSLIGHNSTLDNYSYVANNACVGADVHLKPGAYLGINCSILENTIIGEWALIGMGSVVIQDVSDFSKVVGNPTRVIGSTR